MNVSPLLRVSARRRSRALSWSLTWTRRPAETIAIEFTRDVADYVASREWHKSQQIEERTDGSTVLHLEVSNDQPLRSWILSFGSHARVLAPASLAAGIRGELGRAHEVYQNEMRLNRAS